jgi:hypothetical protein
MRGVPSRDKFIAHGAPVANSFAHFAYFKGFVCGYEAGLLLFLGLASLVEYWML